MLCVQPTPSAQAESLSPASGTIGKERTMTIRFISALALALSLGIVTTACGSSSGVDGNKPLNELTRDDNEKLCEYTADLMKDVFDGTNARRALCSFQGFAFEQSGLGTCEDLRDECMKDDDDLDDEFDDGFTVCDDDDDFLDFPETCDVTVKEFEDCIRAMRDRMKDAFSDITCDSLRSEEGENIFDDLYDPSNIPACESVVERCER